VAPTAEPSGRVVTGCTIPCERLVAFRPSAAC